MSRFSVITVFYFANVFFSFNKKASIRWRDSAPSKLAARCHVSGCWPSCYETENVIWYVWRLFRS